MTTRQQTRPLNIVEFPDNSELAERCERLERELFETREALFAAERRENDLILRFQTPNQERTNQ